MGNSGKQVANRPPVLLLAPFYPSSASKLNLVYQIVFVYYCVVSLITENLTNFHQFYKKMVRQFPC